MNKAQKQAQRTEEKKRKHEPQNRTVRLSVRKKNSNDRLVNNCFMNAKRCLAAQFFTLNANTK